MQLLSDVAGQPADPWARDEALARLTGLSEEHREALLLTGWDGLTAEEAATALGVSPAASRKRLQRARTSLDAPTHDELDLTLIKETS